MSSGIFNQYTGYHNRQSIRLKGFDYSRPGYYFVTICLHDRKNHLFGNIYPADGFPAEEDGFPEGAGSKPALIKNEFSNIVQSTWNDLPNHIPVVQLDEFVMMPNHVHGIIKIVDGAGLEPAPPQAKTRKIALPEIVRQFKTFSAKRINIVRNSPGVPVWQRSYHDQIVRDLKALYFIRRYIRENPLNWNDAEEHHIDNELREFESFDNPTPSSPTAAAGRRK
jgi:putative transposase